MNSATGYGNCMQNEKLPDWEPLPYDLEGTRLDEYKNLRKDWTDWNRVRQICIDLALMIFDFLE